MIELEHEQTDNSMTSIVRKLGVSGEVGDIPSLDRAGERGEVVSRRLTDVARAVESAVAVVIGSTPLGENDPVALLERMRDKRDGGSTFVGQALRELREKDGCAMDEAVRVLGEAWVKNMRVNDKATARTILSVMVSIQGVTQAEMVKACSYTPELNIKDEVFVKAGGNKRKGGRCAVIPHTPHHTTPHHTTPHHTTPHHTAGL